MAERFEIEREDYARRKPSASDVRRLLLLRVGLGLAGFVILIVVLVIVVRFIGVSQRSARIYQLLHMQQPTALSTQSEVRALAASLTPAQARVLAAGRALDYVRLPAEQQSLFDAIHPLTEPGAPAVTPYQVRLEDLGRGDYELRLVWSVTGTGEAVVISLRLE
jgi:hypothetical protein